MQKVLAVLATAIAAVGLTACGDDGDNGSAAGAASQEKVRVYALLPSVEDEAYIREKAGMEQQKGKEKNADITIDAGTARGSADSLIRKVQSAVTQQYDAIAINAGTVADQLTPVLETAVAKGIKVVAFDQDLPDLKGLSTHIAWDSAKAGRLTGEHWAKELLPAGGKIGVIRCFAGNPLLDAVANGFKEGIAGSDIEIVSTIDSKCDIAKSRSAAENMLTAHSDLKGIFADTDLGLEGAIQATKADGGDLILTGSGASRSVLKEMTETAIADATTTFPFEFFGEKAISEAVALARGKQPAPEVTIEPELVTPKNAEQVLDEIVAVSGP